MSFCQRGPLNHWVMVLVSIPMCLWFVSIQVVYDLLLILTGLIATCTYLLLRCLLLNRYGNLFSKVIILSPFISRLLTKIFLLLGIVVIFCDFFWQKKCYQLKVLLLGFATTPRVFTSLPKSILFLCHCSSLCTVIYLFGWCPGPGSLLACRQRGMICLCSLLAHIGLHISFPKSELSLTQTFCFLGLSLDTGGMWDTALGTFFVAETFSDSSTDHILYQWPIRT